jgi:hypothetical protein
MGPERRVPAFSLRYSLDCLEIEFYEVRVLGILRTSHLSNSRKFAVASNLASMRV